MVQRLLPAPHADATDEDLLAWYAPPPGGAPFVRFNFVESLDGAATHRGVSADLGSPADQRIFALLRRHADVVLVGAGTIRAEGYAGDLLDDEAKRWRVARGLPAHPAIAVVSGSLDLDPASGFFTQAPVEPVVLTSSAAPPGRAAELGRAAAVVVCGDTAVDPARAVAALAVRGHRTIHSEGGPALFGAFQASGVVDSLCLTLSPILAGGAARRIARGPEHPLLQLELALALEEDSSLFLEYRRPR